LQVSHLFIESGRERKEAKDKKDYGAVLNFFRITVS